jgi:adenine-specific DNA-methyltransferase
MERIEYIGSKYQIIDWIVSAICSKGVPSKVADLFGGTGIVSHTLNQKLGKDSTIIANDSEPYSSIILRAILQSSYTPACKNVISHIERPLEPIIDGTFPMPITGSYSPLGDAKRMFFTIENAKKIDYARWYIESQKDILLDEEYIFLLASLIVSADKVSNTTSVYGAFLKQFKKRARDPFRLIPIHTLEDNHRYSIVHNCDILHSSVLDSVQDCDVVYLDPPYNQRQYSKNYFPLNVIIKGVIGESELRGKTGIPEDCFVSDFCKKRNALSSFEQLFNELTKRDVKMIVMSYNSEGIVSKENIIHAFHNSGMNCVDVQEKEYSRYKSSRIEGQAKNVIEYVFIATKE